EKYLPALTDQVRSYPVFRASDGFFSELKLRSISLPANIVSLLDKNELAKEPIRASELRTKLSELSPDKGKEEEEMNEYWPYIERALTEPPSEAKPKGSLEASILSKEGELHAFYHAITMIITLTLIVSVVGLTAGLWRYGVAAVALSLHRGQPESTSLGSERAVVGAEEPGKMPEWLTKLLESSSGLVAILGVATLVTAGALAYNGGERAAAEAADKGSANQPAVPDNGSESTSRLPSDLYAQIAADRQAMINQMQEERFSWSREIQEERFSGSREIQALAAYTLEQQRSANERALTTLGQFEKVYDHSLETLVKSESTNLLNLGSTFESSLKSQAAYAAGSLSGLAMCCEPSKTSTNVVTQPTSQPSTEQTQSALLLSNLIALIGVRRAEDSISGAGEKLLQNKQMSDARNFPQRLKAFLVGVPISPTGPDGFICTSVFLPGVDKTVAGDIQLWMRGRQFKSFPSFSTELWGHLEEYFGPVTPGSKQYVWDGALTKEAFSKSQLARLQLYEMVLLSCCPQ
ncbi:MAG TPA: hypothetical protein VEZ90_03030, partial [Blastocatellia bacterium]|nr:hypothetical protein [Blastocatellia bacterium]